MTAVPAEAETAADPCGERSGRPWFVWRFPLYAAARGSRDNAVSLKAGTPVLEIADDLNIQQVKLEGDFPLRFG